MGLLMSTSYAHIHSCVILSRVSGIPQIEKKKIIDFCVKGPKSCRVRGQSGYMHPEAYFREVNNLTGAWRGGVALQREENEDEKRANFPGQRAQVGIIAN